MFAMVAMVMMAVLTFMIVVAVINVRCSTMDDEFDAGDPSTRLSFEMQVIISGLEIREFLFESGWGHS